MGSITKKPSAPTTIIQTVPAVTPVVTATDLSSTTVDEPTQTDAEIASEARTGSLLRRSRGRLGTVLTSFTGFLNPKSNDLGNQQKTLLGE